MTVCERKRERFEGLTPDYRPIRNQQNRYLQDRQEMLTETYTGMGRVFMNHDLFVTETQGAILDPIGVPDIRRTLDGWSVPSLLAFLSTGFQCRTILKSPRLTIH